MIASHGSDNAVDPEPEAESGARPLAGCIRADCSGCEFLPALRCHQPPLVILDFLLPAAVYFVSSIGGMIAGQHWIGLSVWCGMMLVFLLYGQQRLICRRCPQYAQPGLLMKCHAGLGLPKIPRYDPQPMTSFETLALCATCALLFAYYIPFFVVGHQWLLLTVTTTALVAWVWTVHRSLCTRCVNLFCPFNRVGTSARVKLAGLIPDLRAARHCALDIDTPTQPRGVRRPPAGLDRAGMRRNIGSGA